MNSQPIRRGSKPSMLRSHYPPSLLLPPSVAARSPLCVRSCSLPSLRVRSLSLNRHINSVIEKTMLPYRLKILKCFDPTYDWKDGTEVSLCSRKGLPAPELYPPAFRMSVACSNLSFGFGAVEP